MFDKIVCFYLFIVLWTRTLRRIGERKLRLNPLNTQTTDFDDLSCDTDIKRRIGTVTDVVIAFRASPFSFAPVHHTLNTLAAPINSEMFEKFLLIVFYFLLYWINNYSINFHFRRLQENSFLSIESQRRNYRKYRGENVFLLR